MFAIFDWQLTRHTLGKVGQLYCYQCHAMHAWQASTETDWARIAGLRVLPLHHHQLHCTGCDDQLPLSGKEFRATQVLLREQGNIDASPLHDHLMSRVEQIQLADKSAVQLRFIKASMRAKHTAGNGSSD